MNFKNDVTGVGVNTATTITDVTQRKEIQP